MPVLKAFLIALVVALAGCAASRPAEPAGPARPDRLRAEVVGTLPHDPGAFTQGLELSGGTLYEGTGLIGQSSLRAGPPGQPPTTRVDLPAPLFGEGITLVGSSVWQLTWKDGIALERDAATLAERRRVPYSGEGWGLCHQDGRLVMSDGSARLTFRDPGTFAQVGAVTVRDGDRVLDRLNELECAGGAVYANVWQSDEILRIDPASGRVTATIDASGLLTPDEKHGADVLNGIAARPGTDRFLLTGKLWPKLFEVRFVPVR
ncbi:glutaminyl-peptide cyclotransferase [Amycolatopsis anabasis]|uniref:glutaminyl-peptide cyclotransferase n=1 Tax=Amycolatopsis anabasis TaxID=1840409 RepID=UPI00131DA18C|nr:glutaminyl-peptide cyclotransferase [Amycolatopsis anabasis]